MKLFIFLILNVVILEIMILNFLFGMQYVDPEIIDFEELENELSEVLSDFKRFLYDHEFSYVGPNFILDILSHN